MLSRLMPYFRSWEMAEGSAVCVGSPVSWFPVRGGSHQAGHLPHP